jgi:tripartite motif-containing protein 71
MNAKKRNSLTIFLLVSSLYVMGQHRMPQDSWYLDREIPIPSLPGLYHPRSIDVSPSGDIYIAEWANDRVSIWDENGSFQYSFGQSGSADGQFHDPSSIFVSVEEVFVGDWSRHNIQVFTLDGDFLRGWGSYGAGQGQFNNPSGVWIDENGTTGREVYVSDYNNHRVQVFDENGTFLRTFGTYGGGDGQINYSNGVGVGPDDKVYVSSKHSNKIQVFSKDGNFSRSIATNGYPFQIDFHENQLVVSMADHHRIEVFDLNGTSLGYFGQHGNAPGQLNYPTSLAFDATGRLHVSEYNGHRIQIFDTNGSELGLYGFYGSTGYSPYGLDKTDTGSFLITEISGHRVVEIDQNGSVVRVIASEGNGEGKVNHPRDVHLGKDNRIYVSDTNQHRVHIFDRNGTFIKMFGLYGSANGQFNQPWATLASEYEIFVLDRYNHRIQVFDHNGTYLRVLGGYGNLEGKFNSPMDMDWDDEGNIVVVDHSNRRLVHMTTSGQFVRQYTTPSNEHFISNLNNGLFLLSRHNSLGLYDLKGVRLKEWYDSQLNEAKTVSLEDGGFARVSNYSKTLKVYRSSYRNVRLDPKDGIPLPEVLSVVQREGTNLLDINFTINDSNDSKVQAAMLAFIDGGNDLSKVIIPSVFSGSIAGKLDDNVSTNQKHSVAWNVGEDWSAGFGELQVEILAKDNRDLLDLHFLSLPVGGDGNASNLIINRSPLTDTDFLSVWYWLLATGDSGIELIGSSIVPILEGQAPSFQPSDPGNLLAWLDANDLDANASTATEEDGTVVTEWGNLADSTKAFTQANTSKQPTLRTNVLNNRAGVFFDDVDDGLASTLQINAYPYTVAVLFNCLNTSGVGRRAVQGSHNWLIGPYGNRVGYHPNGWASYNRVSLTAEKFYLAVAITTEQESRFYVNGKDETENTGAKYWPGTLHLGASGASTGEKLNGYICEMIAYDKALSSTELSSLNDYFAYKWGIRSSYADGSLTTPAGREYILNKMNLREATTEEVQRAREGAISGSVNQFTPSFQVGPNERPQRVNEYGFDTYTTNGFWVVPKATNP